MSQRSEWPVHAVHATAEAGRRDSRSGAILASVKADYRSGDDYEVEFLDVPLLVRPRATSRSASWQPPSSSGSWRETSSTTTRRPTWSSSRRTDSCPRRPAARSATTSFDTGSEISLVGDESLVYWLRKLVFRSAWLDHRVKEGLLDVTWDDDTGEFTYSMPNGDRALLEMAPVPSWHDVQFRREAYGSRPLGRSRTAGAPRAGLSVIRAIAPTGTIISSGLPSSRHGESVTKP